MAHNGERTGKQENCSVRKPDNQADRKPAEKPVSLHPLGFEDALSALLKVRPSTNKLSPKAGGGDGERTSKS